MRELLYQNIRISLLGHASVKIRNKKIIYIDPFNISDAEKADIILITHGHYDHCSIMDIKKIVKPGTKVLIPPDCQSKLMPVEEADLVLVLPGKTYTVGDVRVETVPAYNTNKQFHPMENDWVGYIINVDGIRIYHAGDSDAIPEMEKIKADIIFLPVGGTYTMTAEQAAEVANKIKPKIAVPMHYGSVVGTKDDGERFKDLVKGRVEILK